MPPKSILENPEEEKKQQATALQADEKAKLKGDFLKEELKYVRKTMQEKEHQMEARKRAFLLQIQNLEDSYQKQVLEDKKRIQAQQQFRIQQIEMEIKSIHQAEIPDEEKAQKLAVVLKMIDKEMGISQ